MASQRIVRVTRTIEYIGEEDWVKATLARSAVGRDGPLFAIGKGRVLREVAATGPEYLAAVPEVGKVVANG